jgi:hypothetical protein
MEGELLTRATGAFDKILSLSEVWLVPTDEVSINGVGKMEGMFNVQRDSAGPGPVWGHVWGHFSLFGSKA